MPLRKINKIIAHNTIDNFNLKNNKALSFIFEQYNIKKKITVEDLGFLIGPIINAGEDSIIQNMVLNYYLQMIMKLLKIDLLN